MMLEGIGTYTVLGNTSRSTAVYHKRPPRFLDSLEEAQPAGATAASMPSIYTVKAGDTLAEIVRRHLGAAGSPPDNVSVFEGVRNVAKQNGLANANRIHPGQTLDLSALGGSASTAAPLPPSTSQAPALDVGSLPPLPGKSAAIPSMVEVRPLDDVPTPQASAGNTSSAGGGKQLPVGPMASFAAQRSGLIDLEAQGGPAHPMGRDLLSELVPEVRYPHRRGSVGPDLGALIDDLIAGKSRASAEVTVPSAAGMPWERAVNGPSRVSSGFGERKDPFTRRRDFHSGMDLAAPHGTEIHPLMAGTVSFSGWKAGYGRVVVVQHDDGIETVYGHNSKNFVEVGDRVDADTVLGQIGSSGRSTGPHLHLEVRQNGRAVDPVAYLNAAAPNTRLAERK